LDLPSEIPEALRSVGVSLERLGLDGIAWSRDDALQVIASLDGTIIAVTEGEVFTSERWGLLPAGEAWSCDRIRNESTFDYAARSQERAASFIEEYQHEGPADVFFALQFSDQDEAA
jgi:hypothetical protein